jgi:hypothetical protein
MGVLCGCLSKEKEDELVQVTDECHLSTPTLHQDAPDLIGRHESLTPAVDLEAEFAQLLTAVPIPNDNVRVLLRPLKGR